MEDLSQSTDKSSRRAWLAKVGMAPLVTLLAGQASANAAPMVSPSRSLSAKELFQVKGTFINAAYTHPISISTSKAVQAYIDRRLTPDRVNDEKMDSIRSEAKELYAKLINASVEEIAWVPSTMVGENLIVSGLGLPGSPGRVVTDILHFEASLYLYGQLAKQGLDVHVVRAKDNRIDLKDLEAAITPGTKLVAISLVSTVNGFQHDLKAVCDLAHSRGALVYADVIQAAGAVPIDVKASGVDFCAGASYKWLMADFGIGFLYVRKDRLEQLKRSQYGYRQIETFTTHTFPFDEPGKVPYEFTAKNDIGGHFQVGTFASGTIAALRDSLSYLLETGVDKIQAYRQPFLKKLQTELPKLGYASMTPIESTSPILAFAYKDAIHKLQPKLDAAGVTVTVYENRFRVSPSVYNDMADMEKLIEALS